MNACSFVRPVKVSTAGQPNLRKPDSGIAREIGDEPKVEMAINRSKCKTYQEGSVSELFYTYLGRKPLSRRSSRQENRAS